jgi:fumarylpyruvate hydrolase
MEHAIPVPPLPRVIVPDGAAMPVRRVWCVGRNYAAHAREMGHDAREAPFHFIKSVDAVRSCIPEGEVAYPSHTADLHHEVELVVALSSGGSHMEPAQAAKTVWASAVGVDLTRRDVQARAKAQRRPWSAGKDFDGAAPVGAFRLGLPPRSGRIALSVDGELRQEGDLDQMIWTVPELLSQLSQLSPLRAGDLVFTGTPAGVGPVIRGSQVHASVQGVGELRFRVV